MAVESSSSRKVDPAQEMEMLKLTTRAGGTYIPPHRLQQMQQQITDKSGEQYQRLTWEALKKSINGLINKVNTSNIKMIIPELFGENLVRGRGLFCRSLMRAQSASLQFTPVYAAVASVINTKIPDIGALLLARLVVQFRRAFRRNDKVRRQAMLLTFCTTHSRLSLGCMSCCLHLYCTPHESTCRPRDSGAANPGTSFTAAYRRLGGNRRRLYAGSRCSLGQCFAKTPQRHF